ncbi:MAG: DUF1592 domain-containing protein [Chthonomonadales bacterium]
MKSSSSVVPLVFFGVSLTAILGAAAVAPRLTPGNVAAPIQVTQTSKSSKATTISKTRSGVQYAKDILPLMLKYCGTCHGAAIQTAGINFSTYKDVAHVIKGRDTWEKCTENIQSKRMPPEGAAQPTDAERSRIVNWVESTLSSAECAIKDPGRITLRRLNREEYNNTIRDLFGITIRPADDFPSDDVGYGFDNIGDVLSVSPILMEKYIAAAEKVSKAVIWTEEPAAPPVMLPGSKLTSSITQANPLGQAMVLGSNGDLGTDYVFPKAGDYIIRVTAWGQQAGPELAKMSISLGGTVMKTVDVKAAAAPGQSFEIRTHLYAGKRKVAAAFLNDYYNANDPDPKNRDRNLVIDHFDIIGPFKERPEPMPTSHLRVIPTEPAAGEERSAASKALSNVAEHAWRRPVKPAELERLLKVFDLGMAQGEGYDKSVQIGLQACLVSPNFLFHVEIDPKPNDASFSHPINDFELASRLSYFLWSSTPDEELYKTAKAGQLHHPNVLEAQTRRMLKNTRSRALVDNFASQWLHLRSMSVVNPDTKRFPDFNDDMRTAMRTETELFCQEIFKSDKSVVDFIDGQYTYLNDRLAKHYGITGISGSEFQKVALASSERGGILTQGSLLTVTSNPTRTSPVKRGKFILEEILGTPPPPPPPGVPELKAEGGADPTATLRQRMELHRKDPSCASCHAKMDPLGFGLENFDAVGQWRTMDGAAKVDASGVLPSGQKFEGPAQLRNILLGLKVKFVKNFTDRLMTYSLGRGLEYYDRCSVDSIVKSAAADKYKFSAIVLGVVKSDPFLMRRGDGGQK